MGNEYNEHMREQNYKIFHESIFTIENNIKKELII